MTNEEIIDLRLPLKPSDPVYKDFLKIKESIGVKNNSEALRFIIKTAATLGFKDIITNLDKNSPKIKA